MPARLDPSRAQRSANIAALFAPGAAAAELWGAGDEAALRPEEAGCCAGFSQKRLAEFAAGRVCARLALQELGVSGVALVRDPDRRPQWPAGIVGSISHTGDFCGAVVARSERFASIGFDAENAGRVDRELWPVLFTSPEIERLLALPLEQQPIAATIRFSAKESFYKCAFGLAARWIDFTDVSIAFEQPLAESGSFRVDAHRADAGLSPYATGRYATVGSLALTGIAVPAQPQP